MDLLSRIVARTGLARPGSAGPLIVMWHGLGGPDGVAPEDFAAQLDLLAARRRIVPLREAVAALGRPEAAELAAITFDDGYVDFAEHALPALVARGLHATLFVPAAWIGERNGWDAGRAASRRLLSAARLRALPAAHVEIGAHGATHRRMAGLCADALAHETRAARARLEDVLGREVRLFAYPYGQRDDFDVPAELAVEEAGFLAACSTCFGRASDESERFRLRRLGIEPQDDRAAVERKLDGAHDLARWKETAGALLRTRGAALAVSSAWHAGARHVSTEGTSHRHRVVSGVRAIHETTARWDALAAQGAVETAYQSRAWIEAWTAERAEPGLEPFLIVFDRLPLLAPFGLLRRHGARVLVPLGLGDSDYPGLVTTLPAAQAWDAVAGALAQESARFDALHLHSAQAPAVALALRDRLGTTPLVRRYETCPRIDTGRSFDALLAARGSKHRNEVRRWEKKLAAFAPLSVERIAPPVGAARIEEIAQVEARSWKWEQGDAAFRSPRQRAFLARFLATPAAPASLWLLRAADGAALAFAIVLHATQRWLYYYPSFRQDAPNAGALLLARLVEAACTEGVPCVDLLRGDARYKLAWADETRFVHEIVAASDRRGALELSALALRWRAARSPRLRALRARLLGVGDRRAAE